MVTSLTRISDLTLAFNPFPLVLHAYNIDINIFQRILLNNQHIRLVNFRSERSPVSSPSARYRHPRPRSTLDDSRLIVSYDWHLPASIHQEANTALSHAEYERLFSWSSGPYRAERKEFLEKARAANIREGRKVPRYGSSLQRIWDWMTLRRWRERRKKRRVAAAAASGADDVHATTKRLSWWQRLKNWFRWKNKRTAPPRTDSSSSTTSDEDFEDAMSSMPIFDPTTADEVDASAIVENVDVVRAPRGVWQCIADMCRFRKNDAASEDVTASGTHQHLHKRDIDMDGVNMLEDVSMKGIGLQLDRATVVYE